MMRLPVYLALPLLVLLAGCHVLVPYDPSGDSGSSPGDGRQPPRDMKFDGLKLEGPVTSLDGGGCQKGILHSDFASQPPDWLPKDAINCGGKNSFGDCGTPCWHVSDNYLEKEFSPDTSIKQFTLGLRFKMVKAPACDVILFRLGTDIKYKSDLDYGIRLVISSASGTPELQLHTRGRITWGPRDARLAKLKESTWYSVELRGRTYSSWEIYLISGAVTGDDGTNIEWTNWSSYQYFYTLKSYQFGALTRECCKPLIDYDGVCFMDRY